MNPWIIWSAILALQLALTGGVIWLSMGSAKQTYDSVAVFLEALGEFRLILQDLTRIEPEREETFLLALAQVDQMEKDLRRLQRASIPWKRPSR